MNEANIIINGVQLTDGQAMAVRVAMAAFANRMISEGLGESDIAKSICDGYIARSGEVEELLAKPRTASSVPAYGPRGQCKVHGCSDPAVTPDGLCNGHFY